MISVRRPSASGTACPCINALVGRTRREIPAPSSAHLDGAGHGLVEGGPAAARVKLGRGRVHGRAAARADVRAVRVELVVLARAGALSALEAQHLELRGCQPLLPLGVRQLHALARHRPA